MTVMIVLLALMLFVNILTLLVFYDLTRCYKDNLERKPLPMINLPKREPKESAEYKEFKSIISNLESYDGTGKNQERL